MMGYFPEFKQLVRRRAESEPLGLSLSEPTLLINAEYFQQIILNQCTL